MLAKGRLGLVGAVVTVLGMDTALGLLDRRYLFGFVLGAVVVVVLLALTLALITRLARQHQAGEPTYPADTGPVTFDHAWTVRAADGADLPLERFRGNVVFVNFWATWC